MTATVANARFNVASMLRAVWPANTAKQVARLVGISHRTVEGWLADRCCPSAETLFAMAEADDRLKAELISILTKKAPANASPLEEGPPFVDRRMRSMGWAEAGEPRPAGALEG